MPATQESIASEKAAEGLLFLSGFAPERKNRKREREKTTRSDDEDDSTDTGEGRIDTDVSKSKKKKGNKLLQKLSLHK